MHWHISKNTSILPSSWALLFLATKRKVSDRSNRLVSTCILGSSGGVVSFQYACIISNRGDSFIYKKEYIERAWPIHSRKERHIYNSLCRQRFNAELLFFRSTPYLYHREMSVKSSPVGVEDPSGQKTFLEPQGRWVLLKLPAGHTYPGAHGPLQVREQLEHQRWFTI